MECFSFISIVNLRKRCLYDVIFFEVAFSSNGHFYDFAWLFWAVVTVFHFLIYSYDCL